MGVSALELDREGPSFTIDTLEHFRSRHPEAELFFLMGEDQLREIHLWREAERLPRLARIVVMARDGVEPGDPEPEIEIEYDRVSVTRIDLSSSQVRNRLREGRSIRYLVPAPVRKIIERHRLYMDTGEPA
jgi:nicotinate-nucleotide adenylyltransferase